MGGRKGCYWAEEALPGLCVGVCVHVRYSIRDEQHAVCLTDASVVPRPPTHPHNLQSVAPGVVEGTLQVTAGVQNFLRCVTGFPTPPLASAHAPQPGLRLDTPAEGWSHREADAVVCGWREATRDRGAPRPTLWLVCLQQGHDSGAGDAG